MRMGSCNQNELEIKKKIVKFRFSPIDKLGGKNNFRQKIEGLQKRIYFFSEVLNNDCILKFSLFQIFFIF